MVEAPSMLDNFLQIYTNYSTAILTAILGAFVTWLFSISITDPITYYFKRTREYKAEIDAIIGYYYCYFVSPNPKKGKPYEEGMLKISKGRWGGCKVSFIMEPFDSAHEGIIELKRGIIYLKTRNKNARLEDCTVLHKPARFAPMILIGTWATVNRVYGFPICGLQVSSRKKLDINSLDALFGFDRSSKAKDTSTSRDTSDIEDQVLRTRATIKLPDNDKALKEILSHDLEPKDIEESEQEFDRRLKIMMNKQAK